METGRHRTSNPFGFVVPQHHIHQGKRFQSTQVDLLVRQRWPCHESSKVVDAADVVMGAQASEEPLKIQPLIRPPPS